MLVVGVGSHVNINSCHNEHGLVGRDIVICRGRNSTSDSQVIFTLNGEFLDTTL